MRSNRTETSETANLFTMAALDNWDSVCRLCSEQKNEMLPIFGNEGMQRKVAQKLRACLPVLVYKTDPLPKQICQFCAARLDDVYEFREYCLNVYKDMNVKLLTCRDIESVRIFLDAMKNSPDPCQVCRPDDLSIVSILYLPLTNFSFNYQSYSLSGATL